MGNNLNIRTLLSKSCSIHEMRHFAIVKKEITLYTCTGIERSPRLNLNLKKNQSSEKWPKNTKRQRNYRKENPNCQSQQ